MDLTSITLVICLCLVSAILGMVFMAIILHPHRQEAKRVRKREVVRAQYQQQMRSLDR